MPSPQSMKFRKVEDFLDYLPDDEKKIVLSLRKIIFDTIPHIKEKISFNVPFYYRHKNICFIWPASVPWGKIDKGVAIGFTKGHLLHDESGYLEMEGRKEVARKIFYDVKEIDIDLLKSFLFEAEELDSY